MKKVAKKEWEGKENLNLFRAKLSHIRISHLSLAFSVKLSENLAILIEHTIATSKDNKRENNKDDPEGHQYACEMCFNGM